MGNDRTLRYPVVLFIKSVKRFCTTKTDARLTTIVRVTLSVPVRGVVPLVTTNFDLLEAPLKEDRVGRT